MEQQKFRVMHKDTGKVREVHKGWLDNAKRFGIFNQYEMIGPVDNGKVVIIEDIPTVYIPPNPNKINRESIGVQIVSNDSIHASEPESNKEQPVATKSKKGRKPKQK